MTAEEIKYELTDDGVGIITINRPEARNALTYPTYAELEDAVREHRRALPRRHRRRPGLLLGRRREAGDGRRRRDARRERLAAEPRLTPAADALLSHRRARDRRRQRRRGRLGDGARAAWPTSASRRSARSSASCSCCAGSAATSPGSAGSPRLVGRETAAELLFTGEVIDAARGAAHRPRVARRARTPICCPRRSRSPTRIAANPPLAVQRLKAGLREALDPDWQRPRRVGELARLAELFRTEDHREGVRAFLEKRPAVYRGR